MKNYILAILLFGLIASCTKEPTKEPNKREYLIQGVYLTIKGVEYKDQALVTLSEGESVNITAKADSYMTENWLKITSNGFIYLSIQNFQRESINVNFKYQ
jgi:hypothetical protein